MAQFCFISVLEFLNAGRELHWINKTSTLIIITYITLLRSERIWRFLKFYTAVSLSGIPSLSMFQLKGKFVKYVFYLSRITLRLKISHDVLSINDFKLMKECIIIQKILSEYIPSTRKIKLKVKSNI